MAGKSMMPAKAKKMAMSKSGAKGASSGMRPGFTAKATQAKAPKRMPMKRGK